MGRTTAARASRGHRDPRHGRDRDLARGRAPHPRRARRRPRGRGLPKAGLSFAYVMIMAELERIAISGANAGKQRTYAAFDERVPPSPPRPRDEALAELAARFIASRGPATERDFASWSGFTLGDTRQAFADAADRRGRRAPRVDRRRRHAARARRGIRRRRRRRVGRAPRGETWSTCCRRTTSTSWATRRPARTCSPPDARIPCAPSSRCTRIVIDGVMVGRWAPVVEAKRARVRIVPWRAFTPDEERSLAASVAEVERFLGLPVTVEHEPSPRPEPARRGARHVRLGRSVCSGARVRRSCRIRLTEAELARAERSGDACPARPP